MRVQVETTGEENGCDNGGIAGETRNDEGCKGGVHLQRPHVSYTHALKFLYTLLGGRKWKSGLARRQANGQRGSDKTQLFRIQSMQMNY